MNEKKVYGQGVFSANRKQRVVTMTPWTEVSAAALVLSANNHMVLREATGHAGWLGIQCPGMHDEIPQELTRIETRPGRGLPPGEGLSTFEGPKSIRDNSHVKRR